MLVLVVLVLVLVIVVLVSTLATWLVVSSLSILGPQSPQGQRLLLHAEDSSPRGGGDGLLAPVYEEMMRGNNPDSHLRILTIPI